MKKERCAIVGDSAFVNELEQIARLNGYAQIDTYPENGLADLIIKLSQYDQVVLGSQDARLNLSFYRELKALNAPLHPLIHPTSYIAQDAKIGEACVIGISVQIQERCQIGVCSVVNASVVIEQDCVVGNGVYLGAHSGLAQQVTVGDMCWMGKGSLVMAKRKVGNYASIGSGAFVMEDVPDDGEVEGEGSYGMTGYCSCCY
ncbi:LbetaH domain-containing protein [Basilea psittacipulmonis]|uniref:PglD N-terminal domain-containing protein n=1 Tax=Basilea psittacipulmonis DSM 24701 TaxID=1072685 RepID=A0A077DHM2_9BURK|nr:hypothetical protein [Basilea psittacipulmonis]AIL33062.1 hypothetical protein IX83_06860 [Basilea psittacipulmonis DSM 24701]